MWLLKSHQEGGARNRMNLGIVSDCFEGYFPSLRGVVVGKRMSTREKGKC
jgi:hypothetical protein